MAKKETTLGDVVESLKIQNELIVNQTKKQEDTDKAIIALAKIMSDYVEDSRLEGLFGDASEKEKRKRRNSPIPGGERDQSTFLADLMKGDVMSALFGAGGALAISLGSILGVVALATNIASITDPKTYEDFSEKLNNFLIRVGGFTIALDKWGDILSALGKPFKKGDLIMRKFLSYAPSNLFGFVRTLGKFFKVLLLFQAGFKTFKASVERWAESGSIKQALLEIPKVFISEITKIIFETVDQFYSIGKFLIKKLDSARRLIFGFFGLDFLAGDWGVDDMFTNLENFFGGFIKDYKEFVFGIINDTFEIFQTGKVGETFKDIEKSFSRGLSNIKNFFTNAWTDMFSEESSFGKIVGFISDRVDSGIDAVKGGFDKILNIFNAIGETLDNIAKKTMKALKKLNPFSKDKKEETIREEKSSIKLVKNKQRVNMEEPILTKSDQPLTVRFDDVESRADEKRMAERKESSQTVNVVNAPSNTSNTTAIRNGDLINMPPMNPANVFDPAFQPSPAY